MDQQKAQLAFFHKPAPHLLQHFFHRFFDISVRHVPHAGESVRPTGECSASRALFRLSQFGASNPKLLTT